MSVCLPSDYFKTNRRMCMNVFPEVYFKPMNKQLDFEDDPDYDPDSDYDSDLTDLHETIIRRVSLAKDQSGPLNGENYPVCDRDPD